MRRYKPSQRRPLEAPQGVVDETPVTEVIETAVVQPEEAVMAMPEEPKHPVCGVNGCTTWYDDPMVMRRHVERQHGLGVELVDLNSRLI